jgi:hypothetical protein
VHREYFFFERMQREYLRQARVLDTFCPSIIQRQRGQHFCRPAETLPSTRYFFLIYYFDFVKTEPKQRHIMRGPEAMFVSPWGCTRHSGLSSRTSLGRERDRTSDSFESCHGKLLWDLATLFLMKKHHRLDILGSSML